MTERLKFLYIPFLKVFLILLVGYTLLHWILLIELELIRLKNSLVSVGFPAILTGVATWVFMRPKLKALNLEAKRRNWRDFYTFILWIIITIPIVISQEYIITATGKLTTLSSINDISKLPETKYYSLENHFLDKHRASVANAFEVSGRRNADFNMNIYIALPIFGNASDTPTVKKPHAWYGIKYHEQVSNRLSREEKEVRYNSFSRKCQLEFDNLDVANFVYLDKIGYSDHYDGFLNAIRQNQYYDFSETVLMPVNEKFELRNGHKLEWIIGSFLGANLIWLFMIIVPKYRQEFSTGPHFQ